MIRIQPLDEDGNPRGEAMTVEGTVSFAPPAEDRPRMTVEAEEFEVEWTLRADESWRVRAILRHGAYRLTWRELCPYGVEDVTGPAGVVRRQREADAAMREYLDNFQRPGSPPYAYPEVWGTASPSRWTISVGPDPRLSGPALLLRRWLSGDPHPAVYTPDRFRALPVGPRGRVIAALRETVAVTVMVIADTFGVVLEDAEVRGVAQGIVDTVKLL